MTDVGPSARTGAGDALSRGPLTGTVLFHLNLAYSSIEERDRAEVVRRCYRPILELAERHDWLKLAVEAPVFTLECIDALDPEWLPRLRALLDGGRVEFVGSGDTQLIGPLVPEAVHGWNQRLGQDGYERLLGHRPRVALVNEMAWSQGLVDGYLAAGYDHVCMEWNNPRRHHPEWEDAWRYAPVATAAPEACSGARSASARELGEQPRQIGLLWIDAIVFQKFQRAVAGDLTLDAYADWIGARRSEQPDAARHLFVYGGDAEIFDWRPGRYATEPTLATGEDVASEWDTVAACLDALRRRCGVEYRLPSEVAGAVRGAAGPLGGRPVVRLTSAADPVPVKKQPKYNLTRWALSGRDDVGLNTRCHARAAALTAAGADASAEDWRALCRAWSSDARTHLTWDRWQALESPGPLPEPAATKAGSAAAAPTFERHGRELRVQAGTLELVLDLRRGLAIQSLRDTRLAPHSLVGTLSHGYFDDIDWSADFYSGHTVVEIPGRPRVADLAPVEPRVDTEGEHLVVTAEVPTALGPLPKRIEVTATGVRLGYGFSAWEGRPIGSLRTAITTLDPEAFDGPLTASCASGGPPERFSIEGEFDHGTGVSPIISARAAFGATDGRFALRGANYGVEFSWSNARCAALPLLANRRVDGKRWCRVSFSVGEVDETLWPGAPLLDFEVELRLVGADTSSPSHRRAAGGRA